LSYEVIARKWRPKNFSQLVGQSHVSQTLLNALKNERLPHAMLFTGPRGTGKTSSARILAKALRCPHAKDFIPCDECTECQDISRGRSLNVMEIDGASNNGVESIRELRESVGYMPSFGKHKVYIIDEVHMLSTSAFNALLKTLEEPPDHVVFIMATTEVQKIPNTILSRCQRFDFRRIPIKLIASRLSEISEADGVKISEEALWMVARQGDGSLRDSQSLLDQVITFSGKEVTLEKVVDVLGLTDRVLLTELLNAFVHRDQQKVLEIVAKIYTSGVDSKIFIKELLEEIRNFLLVKACGEKSFDIVDLPESEVRYLIDLSASLTQEDIHLLFDMALKGANDISRSENAQVVLEMLLLRMSQAPRIENLLALAKGSSDAGVGGSQPQVPRTPVVRSPTPKPSRNFSSPAEKTNITSKTIPNVAPTKNFDVKKTAPSRSVDGNVENKPMDRTVRQRPVTQSVDPRTEELKLAKKHPAEPREVVKENHSGDSVREKATAIVDQKPAAKVTENSSPDARWHDLVLRIKNVNGLIGAQLENTYLRGIDGRNVKIGVPPKVKFLFKRIGDEDFQKKLVNYMTTFWGPGYSVDIQMGSEKKTESLTPKQSSEIQAKEKADDNRKMVEEHPMIIQAQEMFKTEIQSIKEMK
jgi:DNA polymerase III subunit gamma/tau